MTTLHLPTASASDEPSAVDLSIESRVVREIARQLRGLRFGSIEVVVHDGAVTQIERREKVRLPAPCRRD